MREQFIGGRNRYFTVVTSNRRRSIFYNCDQSVNDYFFKESKMAKVNRKITIGTNAKLAFYCFSA